MQNFVITIGRQYGSGGKEIGIALADRLGIKCYDRTLIELATQKSGFSREAIEKIDEKQANPFFVPIMQGYYSTPTGGSFELTMNDKLFSVESEIIKNIAINESAVIVGRCSNVVLKDMPHVLNVFIHAPMEERVKRIMARKNLDEKKATEEIKKIDKKRAQYFDFYTGKKWGDPTEYHVTFSSTLGVNAIVETLVMLLKSEKFTS
ncbi:MAG: AAA family ATPase [Christensenellales bacterium]